MSDLDVIVRAAMPSRGDSCILLMQVKEKHVEILKKLLEIEEATAFYYFARIFEESWHSKVIESTIHTYITKIVVGEEQEAVDHSLETIRVWPVRADVGVSLGKYFRLRLPYRGNLHTHPSFTILESGET